MAELIEKSGAEMIFIAIPSASGQQMTEILNRCSGLNVGYKTIPPMGEMIEGNGLLTQIRDVAVEDLLGRQPVRLDVESIREKLAGRVVLVTSIAAREPVANLLLSNSLRAGLHGLVNALSKEVAADGVTVNALMPGYTVTERLEELRLDEAVLSAQIPARRLGRAQDFGAVAAFLCSDQANYLTGQALACDGGLL